MCQAKKQGEILVCTCLPEMPASLTDQLLGTKLPHAACFRTTDSYLGDAQLRPVFNQVHQCLVSDPKLLKG